MRKVRVVVLLAILGAGAAALTHGPPASSSSTAASHALVPDVDRSSPPSSIRAIPIESMGAPAKPTGLAGEPGGALGEAGGSVPDGTTVFDDEVPGVANLAPDLRAALRRAAAAAASDGSTLLVDSGWRSPEYQAQLLERAVSQYGSQEEAARWVATPETSPHVSGDAIDIGPSAAATWLSEHGAQYGLCQIYGNEPWHYELRPEAATRGCPAMYGDPTQDPRMQR
jgi:D-alanyl-D-alanine carboxypeptidase